MKHAMTVFAFDSKWLEKIFIGAFPAQVFDNLIPIKSSWRIIQKFYAEGLELCKARDNNLHEEEDRALVWVCVWR